MDAAAVLTGALARGQELDPGRGQRARGRTDHRHDRRSAGLGRPRGLPTTELMIRPAAPPEGVVRLRQARVDTFRDSENPWANAAVGDVVPDGFDYGKLNDTHVIDVRTRPYWIERVVDGYATGSYDQLASALRRAGREELAGQVSIGRRRRRYAAAARTRGVLQRAPVAYGYRPWSAACKPVGPWALGGTWFAFHERPPIDAGQNPARNPWTLAADRLLPIPDLGQGGGGRMAGAAQWIAGALVAAGGIRATTAAAGVARALKRV